VVELRAFLNRCSTTRNGRPGGQPKRYSVRQIRNILECLRSVLAWARRAEVRKLPADWIQPLSDELIPAGPQKDPLRGDPVPLESRIALVGITDAWQLCHLALSLTLPLRPEEAVGLLISDVDLDRNCLKIGSRLQGDDFTKGGTSFILPFPQEVRQVLGTCIGGRAEGPLLRSRRAFEGSRRVPPVTSFQELEGKYRDRLARAPVDGVITEQDRKDVFRRLLRELGGASTDRLAAEFKTLASAVGLGREISMRSLRHATTTGLKKAKLSHLELRYLTSHSTADILNEYTGLDLVQEMERYFDSVRPLLLVMRQRATALGLGGLNGHQPD
jgi:integrase